MPVYEYRCTKCGQETEVIVLPSEKPPARCRACKGKLQRRWSRIGVQLSGWGFAKTDGMIADSPTRKSFKTIKDKAGELFD